MKVSICIAAFNKPTLLKETLNSIVCQHPPFEFEVIVVDDGSPKACVSEVCKPYPLVQCIRLERHPAFRNPCWARNTAYRLAIGEIIIAQSDEVIHSQQDTIQTLVDELKPGTFVIATVYNKERNGQITSQFTGPKRQKPYFFLGALYRSDLYTVGGNDEDFGVGTGYEDAWFSDCLTNGLGLTAIYSTRAQGFHQWHKNYNTSITDEPAKQLYMQKTTEAIAGRLPWQSTGGAWPMTTDAQMIFRKIHETKAWGENIESVSGAGSSMAATTVIRETLPNLFKDYRIRSVLDLGCGDCNWISSLDWSDVNYLGLDLVPTLVEQNKTKHQSMNFGYLQKITDELPYADLVLVRDCLQHLCHADALTVLNSIYRSGARYLLATTFPQKANRTIKTGQWAPYNLQQAPFNLATPTRLINEQCTELYPHFADKSLGLWVLDELPIAKQHRVKLNAITVCVGYSDKLTTTLPLNRIHFDRYLIVTDKQDTATHDLACKYGCDLLVTNAFKRYGALFNKGLAIEEAFDQLGRRGWFCILDADIVLPDRPVLNNPDKDTLYVPIRRVTSDIEVMDWSDLPSPTKPNEFDGYCQIFNAGAEALKEKPWYGIDWIHAGGGDSDFEHKYTKKQRPPFEVLHLGLEGKDRIGDNWLGIGNAASVDLMRKARKQYGTVREKLRPVLQQLPPAVTSKETYIPKVMRFFWQGNKMSWLRALSVWSFRYHNPDWRVELHLLNLPQANRPWKTGELDDRNYDGVDYSHIATTAANVVLLDSLNHDKAPAHNCDLYQWWLLGENPGWYCDMDVLWIKPFTIIPEAEAVFCMESGYVAIGLVGSNGSKLFRDLYHLGLRQTPVGYQTYGADLVYQLANLSRLRDKPKGLDRTMLTLRRRYANIVEIPQNTIYPFDWRQIDEIFEENRSLPDDTYGIHWFGGSKIAQKWNSLLTPSNWFKYLSTITKAIGALTYGQS